MYSVVRKNFTVNILESTFEVICGNEKIFTFSARSSVPSEKEIDTDGDYISLAYCESGDMSQAVWTTQSSLWEKKEYRLNVSEDSLLYSIVVYGKGRVGKIEYFSGKAFGRRNGAYYQTAGYMLPMPVVGSQNHYYTMAEEGKIRIHLMTPPPFCFPFMTEDRDVFFGLGLVAKPGEHNFDGFSYKNTAGRFILSTDIMCAKNIDGSWETPAVLGCPGKDEWDVLGKYAEYYYENICDRQSSHKEKWWRGPLFCGWGEQAILAGKYGTDIYGAASQMAYTEMSRHLDKLGLCPSAIIIDDKWQRKYGESLPDEDKWPDMRGFTDDQHKKGRKVVLWFKCWNPEGLDDDECIKLYGLPVAADPTNPKYINRIENTIYKLLSSDEGCYNCDGFKIDFADCFPKNADIKTYEKEIGGTELVHRLIKLIRSSAKKVKSDALINCSGCHPYMADVTDEVRLHDYDDRLRSIRTYMSFRAKLYSIMLPDSLVDTDFPSFAGHRDTMEYIRLAPRLGVPDIYRISDTEQCVFTNEDRTEIKEIWDEYIKNLKSPSGRNG